MSQNWVDQVKSSGSTDDGNGDGGASESLFQDNFRRLVNDDDVESLNVQTIEKQIDKIDDTDLLETAIEIDSRKGSTEAYEDRLDELGAGSDETEQSEPSAEAADEPTEEADDESDDEDVEEAEEADDESSGSSWVDDVNGETDGESTEEESDADAVTEADGELEAEVEANAEELVEEMQDDDESTTETTTDDDTDSEGGDTADEAVGVSEPAVSEADGTGGNDLPADGESTGSGDSVDEVTAEPSDGDETLDGDDLDEILEEGSESSEPTDDADGSDDTDLPDINVGAIAPNATSSEEAAAQESTRTLLVWGPEGTGKSHVAHSAPKPVCYIDTEGKADELAEKFDDVYYWQPEDYSEAEDALDDALEVLAAFREKGVTGTIVVDSMGVMWEWAQMHHMKLTRPSKESLDDVQFTSAFSGDGGGDWQKIKGYHNTQFRDVILESPYNVVFTAGRKEKYDFDGETMDSRWEPEGEKRNKYAVKEVVRLRTDGSGHTVADLHKAARTKYSFANLQWPEWDDVYGTIDEIAQAEQAPEPVDTSQWDFDIYEGQPLAEGADGGDTDESSG